MTEKKTRYVPGAEGKIQWIAGGEGVENAGVFELTDEFRQELGLDKGRGEEEEPKVDITQIVKREGGTVPDQTRVDFKMEEKVKKEAATEKGALEKVRDYIKSLLGR